MAHHAFGFEFDNRLDVPVVHYDMKSRHAALFGGANGYLYDRDYVFRALHRFVQRERAVTV